MKIYQHLLPSTTGRSYETSLPCQPSDVSSPYRKPMARSHLFHHFVNSIASQLVWIDNAQNPWRQFICPLAAKSPCVFYAVLAIAAANLHVNFESDSPYRKLSFEISQTYRQKTVFLLTHHLSLARRSQREETTEGYSQRFRESLAATLLLWHLEMHFPSDSLWKLHLRTAEALIYGYHQKQVSLQEGDACNEFLLSEYYCATIWPRLTLSIDMEETIVRPSFLDKSNPFMGFVTLMHRIIILTPWSRTVALPGNLNRPIDVAELESQATKIRQAILSMQVHGDLNLPNEKLADVVHVVDAWFYAILIFGYRVIGSSYGDDKVIESDCDCLFEALSSLSSPLSFSQNQPWPLFIAGTECVGDKDRQMWVESRFHSLINSVCPLDRPRMLQFLKEWWLNDSPESRRADCWIKFRQECKSNLEFIIW